MLKEQILKRLQEMQQPHLGAQLDLLSLEKQEAFLAMLSPALLKSQQETLRSSVQKEEMELVKEAQEASEVWLPLGIERLTQGKVACLILAGGQGSRLGSTLPKALIPVSPDGRKTLLELHLEKIAAASMFHQAKIPCAVITSPENHAQILQFLQEHAFFGVDVTLVTQTEAPFLDEEGNWILKEPGQLAMGPDGNGHALHLLAKQGVLKEWKRQGIEEITIVPIDNPLADPVDPVLIGYHVATPAEVTVKVIQRQNAEEKVGVMVRKKGAITVQEYSELPPQQTHHALAHIGLFALNLSFAEKVVQHDFPWHLAKKHDNATGKPIWKFEHFIFDMLPYSQKTNLLLYPREDVYAPLKNATGEKSLATVQAALQRVLSS